MIKIILVSLIFSMNAYAQTKTKVTVRPAARPAARPRHVITPEPSSSSVGPIFGTGVVAAAPDAAAPAKSPWRLSYYGEYVGPALSNFDLQQTQVPGSPSEYTGIYHQIKVGYAVAKNVTIGTVFRANAPFNPLETFGFYDQRFYSQWSHMIETSDIDMSGKLTFELPTTDASRNKGKILAVRFDENFTLKTSLRNWSFTANVTLKPTFYNDPFVGGAGRTDFDLSLAPYITMDVMPNIQLLFEGYFDANHNYTASFGEFQSSGADYLDIGPIITLNSHMNTNVALRFYTSHFTFDAANVFVNLEAAL